MDANYEFFLNNQANIIAGHENLYVVIKDQSVVGYFLSELDALSAMKGNQLGTFIIQKCVNEKNGIVEFYSRRVIFA